MLFFKNETQHVLKHKTFNHTMSSTFIYIYCECVKSGTISPHVEVLGLEETRTIVINMRPLHVNPLSE